ncbi:hypothetical protein [Polaromonas naphthalenivorans]|nr:hypothetical protein [Polaromonas naphthalenivorans]
MRKMLIVMGLVMLLAGVGRAADIELDTDLMQTIEDTNLSLASNIALKDGKSSKAEAAELHRMFTQVEAHFVAKGDAADAVDLSKKSKDWAGEIVQSVDSKQFDHAAELAGNISRACKTCHNFYKKS